MKKILVNSALVICIVFLAYLLILIAGFYGIKTGLTNTPGKVDDNNAIFEKNLEAIARMEEMEKIKNEAEATKDANEKLVQKIKNSNYCKINAVGDYFPFNSRKIVETYERFDCDPLIAKMVFAANLRLRDNQDFQYKMIECENSKTQYSLSELKNKFGMIEGKNVFSWIDNPEWKTIREGVIKDKDKIIRAAEATGVTPRLIVASLIVEQLRLFNSEREIFKRFFEPLKILGNATQISLGVMGIKEATAIQVENHLKDPTSPYYLGKEYENSLDFSSNNPTQERFQKLTNDKDHYYCYLYGAFYLKQMISQWEKDGYEIKYRPEIVGTLFNVGFPQSKPKAEPKVGGSAININGSKYSFGSLAYEFYYSGELADEFPLFVE